MLAAQPLAQTRGFVPSRLRHWEAALQGKAVQTLVWLSPVSGSTLLSLISIIREDIRREAGLISPGKAPCQLGNLCTGLGCTNRCTHRDWAFLTPCSQQVFHYAQELLTAEATCLVMWEQNGVIPEFLMLLFWSKELQGSYISMYDAFSHCMCLDTQQSSSAWSFLREEDKRILLWLPSICLFLFPCTAFKVVEKERKNTMLRIVSLLHCTFPISKYSPDGKSLFGSRQAEGWLKKSDNYIRIITTRKPGANEAWRLHLI